MCTSSLRSWTAEYLRRIGRTDRQHSSIVMISGPKKSNLSSNCILPIVLKIKLCSVQDCTVNRLSVLQTGENFYPKLKRCVDTVP